MSFPAVLAAAVVVIAVVVGILVARQKDPERRAAVLTRTGLVLMTAFTVFAGAFTAGYAVDEAGGTAGLMMILVWAVPMLVLAVLGWFWPAGTGPLLAALTVAFVAACVWFALDPSIGRGFQAANGPVLAVAVVALSFPAAVLGLKRTRTAGRLLLATGALPLLITLLGRSGPVASLAAASVVPLITGAVYLIAARTARGTSRPAKVRSAV